MSVAALTATLTITATDKAEAPRGDALTVALEHLLQRAQPRLMRVARSYGVSADVADDIVQETRIQAWRHLEQVRSADRFDAWLDAICRNQSRMYLRAQQAARRRIDQLPYGVRNRAECDLPAHLIMPDLDGETLDEALVTDPSEEVERRELTDLLNKALAYLPPPARAALELRYLHGYSLAETAATLETSAEVQETRLRRARARLRETLLGPLRHEAATFGLAPDAGDTPAAWQTTRITCYLCGRHSLAGRFEPLPDRHTELRLRCPHCSRQHGVDVFRSKGLAPLDDVRMFRPAFTRSIRALEAHAQRALASGRDTCLHCGTPVQRQIVTPAAFPDALPLSLQRHWLVAPCPRAGCPGLGAWPATEPALWSDPAARRFMADHPRWRLAAEEDADWQGCPAIVVCLADGGGAARLSLVMDRASLRVLAAYETRP